MLLDLLNQFSGTLFLVITKTSVVELDEEASLSAGFVGHFLHVGLHLLNSGPVVRDRIFRVSGFSLTQETALASIRLHVH